MTKKKTTKTQKRFRLRFPFWLDLNKPDEAEVADAIAILKEQRSFSKTIRDGIRLICDLRAGQVDVLFELFPWVKETLTQTISAAPTTALERQLERLESMLKEQGDTPALLANYSVIKPSGAPPVATIKAAPVADANTIADNFLAFIQ